MPTLPESKIEDARKKAENFLVQVRHKEDGWFPYKAGGQPALEATAWGSLALNGKEETLKTANYLAVNQNEDGGWSTTPGAGRSDWSTAPSLLCIRLAAQYLKKQTGEKEQTDEKEHKQILSLLNQAIKRGKDCLFDSRTQYYKPAARILLFVTQGEKPLNYARGWPWDPDCFHWIEPTAYALMALKLPETPSDSELVEAISSANRFILSHACQGGGWNHGNDITLGAHLPAYRLTTAEALLALQDVEDEKIQAALKYLRSWQDKDTSCQSLAMSALALQAYGLSADAEIGFLLARQAADGSFAGTIMATAMSCLALTAFQNQDSSLFFRKSKS